MLATDIRLFPPGIDLVDKLRMSEEVRIGMDGVAFIGNIVPFVATAAIVLILIRRELMLRRS